jgi:hypothetical protein
MLGGRASAGLPLTLPTGKTAAAAVNGNNEESIVGKRAVQILLGGNRRVSAGLPRTPPSSYLFEIGVEKRRVTTTVGLHFFILFYAGHKQQDLLVT